MRQIEWKVRCSGAEPIEVSAETPVDAANKARPLFEAKGIDATNLAVELANKKKVTY
jgi:hypothetical protein